MLTKLKVRWERLADMPSAYQPPLRAFHSSRVISHSSESSRPLTYAFFSVLMSRMPLLCEIRLERLLRAAFGARNIVLFKELNQ